MAKYLVPLTVLVLLFSYVFIYEEPRSVIHDNNEDMSSTSDALTKPNTSILANPLPQFNVDKSAIHCKDYLKPISNYEDWRVGTKEKLFGHFERLSKDLSHKENDLISHFSGFGLTRYRYRFAEAKEELTNADNEELSPLIEELVSFQLLPGTTQTQELRADNVIPLIFTLDLPDPISIIAELHANGLHISGQDLTEANKLNIPLVHMVSLHQLSGLDANRIYLEYGFYRSLLIDSLVNKNLDLALYWLEVGADPMPDLFSRNALDYMPIPNNESEAAILVDIFELISDKGVLPMRKSTVAMLNTWLPQAWEQKHKTSFPEDKLKTYQPGIPKSMFLNVFDGLVETFEIALDEVVAREEYIDKAHPCFMDAGYILVKRAASMNTSQQASPLVTLSYAEKAENLLTQLKSDGLTDDGIVQTLLASDDTVSKNALDKLRMEQLQSKTALQGGDLTQSIDADEYQKLKDLMSGDDVEEGVEYLRNLDPELSDSASATTLLFTALSYGEDINKILALIHEGGVLPENAITFLIKNDSLSHIKALLPYGLDIYFTDEFGRNSVWYSSYHNKPIILQFLAEKGVMLENPQGGTDSLDIALRLVNHRIEYVEVIKLLVNYGISIEDSHTEKLNDLKKHNPILFNHIVENTNLRV